MRSLGWFMGSLAGLLLIGCSDGGTKPPVEPVFVRVTTTKGTIVFELDAEKAPVTVDNFLRYVDTGFYEGTIFHRVMPGFVIQGGGFTEDMTQRTPTYPSIPLESQNGLKNDRGTIAMARTSQPNSATCQFYINLKGNAPLNYNPSVAGANGYAVFGKVVDGMAVVDSIARVPTSVEGAYQNVPIVPIVIGSVRLQRSGT